MTAHSWNPSPVGRRYPEFAPADRNAFSAFAFSESLAPGNQAKMAKIVRKMEVVSGDYRLYVDKPEIFPAAITTQADYANVDNVVI